MRVRVARGAFRGRPRSVGKPSWLRKSRGGTVGNLRVAQRTRLVWAVALISLLGTPARAADPWVVYEGGDGPGKGKHVVLVSGDEEYRSEEALPQLAKILAKRHGFNCTVLFAIGQGRHDRPEPRRQHPRPRGAPTRPT